MAEESSTGFLVPLKRPLFRQSVTYPVKRKQFLKVSRKAAKRMTAFGTGWRVDGQTSTVLFLKRVGADLERLGIIPKVEFELAEGAGSILLSLYTHSESEAAIFQNFVQEVQLVFNDS